MLAECKTLKPNRRSELIDRILGEFDIFRPHKCVPGKTMCCFLFSCTLIFIMILTRVKRENINIQIYKWIEPTHTLNPPQIQEFKSTEFASGNLLKRGFSSTTRNWIACTTNLYHQIRRNTFPSREWFLPTIVPLIIGGTAYNELIRDNYRRVKGQWVGKKKWPKKKPRRTITTQTISMAFADPPPILVILIHRNPSSTTSMNSSTMRMVMLSSHSWGMPVSPKLLTNFTLVTHVSSL